MTITPDLDVTVRILDSSGTLVLDVSEANGYYLVDLGVPERTWRRILIQSPFVDGDELVSAVLEAGAFNPSVRVSGGSWVQVDTRRLALIDAAEQFSFLLEVTVAHRRSVWRAARADSSNPVDKYEAMAHQSTVTLKVPVQPTALVTTV